MKNKQVLIVSHSEDGSAKLLMQRLSEMNQSHSLIDLGNFLSSAHASIEYSGPLKISFSQTTAVFNNDSVKSVWWRRPKGKVKPAAADAIRKYVDLESDIFTTSIFSLLTETLWVSDPEKTRTANNKPAQLEIARGIGLDIPKTLISNDPDLVKRFLETNWNIPLTMKPVGTSFVRMSDDIQDPEHKNLSIYTRIMDKDEILKNIERVSNCPAIFQEAAMQEFDVRVTVVGERIFASKISHSKDNGAGPTNLDWRNHNLVRTYEKHDLPSDISDRCVQLTEKLGLRFGALDLCYSKAKGYTFLEINPQGQWIPSEVIAGHPISRALAELLSG